MLNSPLQFHKLSAKEALRDGVNALQRARIESASLDARLLLQHVLGISCEEWLGGDDKSLDPRQEAQYQELLAKRARRQPVAQLIGKREFWGMCFRVTEDTLDPRPDSEAVIEAVMGHGSWVMGQKSDSPMAILDLGTGTGCLLLSLLKEWPEAQGLGVDISEKALEIAKHNAGQLGMEDRADFASSCWGEAVSGMFDVIVSNPPYIASSIIPWLAPEVSRYEPKLALDGGEDGLDAYRAILPQVPHLLAKDGIAAFEIGAGQQKEVENIARKAGLAVAAVKEDLGGIPRCIVFRNA